MIYPNNFETKIGFNKVRELVQKHCLGSLGRDLIDEVKFSISYKEINTMVNQVNELKQICVEEDNFPVSYFIDVRTSLSNVTVEGTYLELNELYNLKRSLESISAILRFFNNKEETEYPYLRKLTSKVKTYPYINDRINDIITKHGRMKDNASRELQNIRSSIFQKQSTISKRMQAILKSAQKEGLVDQDVTLSIRDGRAVIPVPSAFKRKIHGIVHDESSTGKTSYIEPVEIVETNNEIRELEYAERREMIRILHDFTSNIRPYIPDLFLAYDFMAQIDFIRAKALFALQVNAILPNINDTPDSLWKAAIHPLLFLSLQKENRSVVPLDVEINDKQRIILISGPNAGGKSICLKSMGLIQYMFQCGFLVNMDEESQMGIYDKIFIDIGDEQSLENDLSTYSSHLVNMKNFVRHADKSSLILIDEFGTGTEPMLGGAIAESILNKLNNKKVRGVITTHYTNLKHFASEAEGIENGAMLYDSHNMQALFKLEIGKPGSSFAFEIARKIGLPEDILKSATDKIGADHINFDKHLRDIVRDKRYWESKRDNIRKSDKKLDGLVEKYEIELKEASKLRKEIITQAKEEAAKLLADANKSIEKTIRVIKESQANKEKTQAVRKEFEQVKQKIIDTDYQQEDRLQRKINQLNARENRKKNKEKKEDNSSTEKLVLKSKGEDLSVINIGDVVRLDNQRTQGEVIEINKKNAVVAFGILLTSVKINRLSKISKSQIKKEEKKFNQTSMLVQGDILERKMNFKPDIDVRGHRAEEALRVIMDHVDEIIMLDVREFRILHGTGFGVLRNVIRDYLDTVDLVESCRDEKQQLGGSGITIVSME